VMLEPLLVPVALTVVSGVEDDMEGILPREFAIAGVYPNPFNALTTVNYSLPYSAEVSLTVFDLSGRRVTELVNGRVDAGWHNVVWDAADMPSGLYFVRLTTAQVNRTAKVMLIR
jgi:hypothetical protein